jgi:hypothetical protein
MLTDNDRKNMWASHTKMVREATSPAAAGGADQNLSAMGTPVRRFNYTDTFRMAMGENVEPTVVDSFFSRERETQQMQVPAYRGGMSPLVVGGMQLDTGEGERINVGGDPRMSSSAGAPSTLDGLDLFGLAEADMPHPQTSPAVVGSGQGAPFTATATATTTSTAASAASARHGATSAFFPSSEQMVSITMEQYEALRSTNEALAGALADERAARLELDERVVMLTLDSDESKTHNIVDQDSLRLEVARLQALVRQMSREGQLEGVFGALEEEGQRLARENAQLRKKNLKLEEARLGGGGREPDLHDTPVSRSTPSKAGREGNGSTPIQRLRKIQGDTPMLDRNEVGRLKQELRKVLREKDALAGKLAHLGAKERHYRMATKMLEDSKSKLAVSFGERQRARDQASAAAVECDHAQAALRALQSDTAGLKSDNALLKKEVTGLRAEVNMHRKATSTYSAGQRRAAVLKQGLSSAGVGSGTACVSKVTTNKNVAPAAEMAGFSERQDEDGYFSLQPTGAAMEPTGTSGSLHPSMSDQFGANVPPLPVYTRVLTGGKENAGNKGNSGKGRRAHPGVSKSMDVLEEALQTTAPQALSALRELEFQLDGEATGEIISRSRALGKSLSVR